MADRHHGKVDDQRVGASFRAARIKRRLRQEDLAILAKVSRGSVSRVERGHLDTLSLRTLRAIAAELDIRIEVQPRWRGGDLDRMLNQRHSALHESVALAFHRDFPAWTLAPEVSFSIWGERGLIDLFAWHPGARALVVMELKTDIADANELVGTVDRKRRLARQIARERGLDPATVSVWVIVSESRTNRRRIAAHAEMFRTAFPADARSIKAWLRQPERPISALSTWHSEPTAQRPAELACVRRVRRPRAA
jgi:transcriptional regulator with XRE-family HTH domain